MWLNHCGCQAVWRKLKKGVKMHLPLFWAYITQPDHHIGWAKSMSFTSIYPTRPRTNPWNFCKKYWQLAELENDIILSGHFDFFLFRNFFKSFHMRYHLFLHYGLFLQNLEKDFIQTNMYIVHDWLLWFAFSFQLYYKTTTYEKFKTTFSSKWK